MGRPVTKRDDIINVALRLFAEKGIKATTIRDIAAAAGVTEGALYRHFDSKSDLARYLFADGAEHFYDYLDQATREFTEAPERLRGLVCAFHDFAEEYPAVFGYVMARHYESVGEPPATQRLPKKLFLRAITEGMAQGRLRRMDPELAAALVIGMCVQSLFFLQRGLIEADAEQVKCQVCGAVDRVFAVADGSGE